MISHTLANPTKPWTKYCQEQSISYYCMLEQYHFKTETASEHIYHTANPALHVLGLLQNEPDNNALGFI